MDRISRKMPLPTRTPVTLETATLDNKKMMGSISKWVPLICAGGAVALSIIALKELKNTRKEIMLLKKETFGGNNEEISKRMENMEEQLRTLTDFIKKNKSPSRSNYMVPPHMQSPPIVPQQPRQTIPMQQPSPHPQFPYKQTKFTPEETGKKKVKEEVIKNVIDEPVPTEINIINEEEDEYEEVEVTDDENEEN
jgi:hypothetical protein